MLENWQYQRIQKKGLVGIESEVKAGEVNLFCRRNKVEINILSERLTRAACDGASEVLVLLEEESGEKRSCLLQEIDLPSGF